MSPLIFYFISFLIFLPIKCGHYRPKGGSYPYQGTPRLIQHASRPPYVQICQFLKPKPTLLSNETPRQPKRSKSRSKSVRFRNVPPPLLIDSEPSLFSGDQTPELQFHLWEHLYPVSTFINGRPHKTQIPVFIQQSPPRQNKLPKSFPKTTKSRHQSNLESVEHEETPLVYDDEFLNIAFDDESSAQSLAPAKTSGFKNYEQKMPNFVDFAEHDALQEAGELYQDSQLSEISEFLPNSGDLEFPEPEPDKETLNLDDNNEETQSDIEVEFPQSHPKARLIHVTFDGTKHSNGPKVGPKMNVGFSQMSVSIQNNLNDTAGNVTEFSALKGNFTVNSTILGISENSSPLNSKQTPFNKE